MKMHLIAGLFVLALGRVQAESEPFYVAAHEGIFRGEIESATGSMTPLVLAVATHGPGFLALSPTRPVLYATFPHTIGAFQLKPDGSLSPLNEMDTDAKGACHVAVDRTGRFVFAANYGSGNLSSFSVAKDGAMANRLSVIPFQGSGPDKERQTHPFIHSVYPDPENRFVYVCDLGTDYVWIFKLDAKTGSLTAANPPSAKVPPGSGPRHLAFSPDAKFVYVASEMGASVTVFTRDAETGALHSVETVSTLASDAMNQKGWAAEIVCHPNGRWLYVSNRSDNTIGVFALAADGKAKLIQSAPALVDHPRSFWLDLTGKWLIAAGEADGRLAVLKIDPATGKLSPTDQSAHVMTPECVLFVGGKK